MNRVEFSSRSVQGDRANPGPGLGLLYFGCSTRLAQLLCLFCLSLISPTRLWQTCGIAKIKVNSQPNQGPRPAVSPCRTSRERERDMSFRQSFDPIFRSHDRGTAEEKATLSLSLSLYHSFTPGAGSLAQSRLENSVCDGERRGMLGAILK